MNATLRPLHKLLVLPLLVAALVPAAPAGGGYPRPSTGLTVGRQIAEQGNRALAQIRAEARPALQLPEMGTDPAVVQLSRNR